MRTPRSQDLGGLRLLCRVSLLLATALTTGACMADAPNATLTIKNDLSRTVTYRPCDDFGCDNAAVLLHP